MIYIFTGKPRAGKSYGAMVEAYREAIGGCRAIIMSASMGVKAGELNALVQERRPEADFDPVQRLRLLNDEEVKNFWCHRIINGEHVTMPFTDLGAKATPTLYVIDEAHIYFDARRWAEAGPELTRYNSQHAKIGLGDVVIFVTQFPDLLDKRVRGFAQEYHLFRNLGFEKLFWFFRAPSRFFVGVYYGVPDRTQKPAEVHYNRIDLRIAGCYDTSAGVGVVGRGAPEMQRRKTGFSWKWLILLGALAIFAVSYAPEWFMKNVVHKFRPEPKPAETKEQTEGRELIERVAGHRPRTPHDLTTETNAVPAIYVRSISSYGKRWRIDLSDGRIFTDETGGISSAGRDWIKLDSGEVIFRRYGSSIEPVKRSSELGSGVK